jgi:hypothetical protein
MPNGKRRKRSEPLLADVPTTLDEAVEVLLRDLGIEGRETLAKVKEQDLLSHYDIPLGEYCRRYLGLDGRNFNLLLNCEVLQFGEAVEVVMKTAWNKVKEQQLQK